ncbi:hypothetical protein [Pendulispora albinea]|uniref:Uncharacterized protein n=1 Tax=Pendulispora albinea TaxID=2741071 RepID=A0ABZ2M0H5_9BACT
MTQSSEEHAEEASADQASALGTRTSFYATCTGTRRWGPTDGRPIEWANASSCKKYNGYYGGYTALPSSESPCHGDVANINGELHCR